MGRKLNERTALNEESLNISVRKFLKTVGVNSQLAIEKAVRKARETNQLNGEEVLTARMTLTVDQVDVNVTFDGEVRLG
jgi:hypothetical protein